MLTHGFHQVHDVLVAFAVDDVLFDIQNERTVRGQHPLELFGDGQEPWRFISKDENPENGVDEDALFAKIKELLP